MILAVSESVRERVELARVPEGGLLLLGVVVLALAVVGVIWLYRREGEAAAWRKVVLSTIRVAILAAVVLVFLDPVRTRERIRELDAVTVVLVDESASMSVPDLYPEALLGPISEATGVDAETIGTRPRSKLIGELLDPVLGPLAKRNPVRVLGFSDGVRPLAEIPRGGAAAPLEPAEDGRATDLAAALRAAMEGGEGRPVAAVVVVSDGRSNRGEDPTVAAEALARRGIPLHAVGIGDPTEPRNAAITDFRAPHRALAGEPFHIEVRLRGTGIAGEETQLVIRARAGPGAAPRTVGEFRIRFPKDERELTVEAEDRVDRPGRLVYEAVLDPLDRETTDFDNRDESPVEIVDEQVRLLLVAGGPSREYRALRALFTRDETVSLSCWLQSADPDFPQDGDVRLERLPDTRRELFEYDVVLLLDPEPSGLGAGYAELLLDLVRTRGGGLGFVAGPVCSLAFLQGAEGTVLRRALPVVPDLVAADRRRSSGAPSSDSWSLEPTREGDGHTLTRIGDSREESAEIWRALPGFYSTFAVDREKPGAVPLLRSTDPRSLGRFGPPIVLAAQRYGAGRTLFLGSGETWRWRGRAETQYDRFWLGVVRYLSAGRLGAGGGRLHVETDRDVYDVGERIEVRARSLGESYDPTPDPTLPLRVRRGDAEEETVRLEADPARPGWFRGWVVGRTPGWIELSLDPRAGDEAATRSVRIARLDRELQDPRLDRSLLARIADRTGGGYLDPGDVARLVEAIPDRRERLVVPASSEPLWDTWWTLLLLGGLFTAEWVIRKWSGMT